MTYNLTAQNIFNGPGFDDAEMLRKAKRELDRLKGAGAGSMNAYDHMMNFAVSLAAVSDWTFHVHLADLPRWQGKKEHNFTNWIRHHNADAFVFIDISNEYKHANRNTPSAVAEKMMLRFVQFDKEPEMRAKVDTTKGWVQTVGSGAEWFFFPSIQYGGKSDYFYNVAERAIVWWESKAYASAEPMDMKGNVL
ncbi:hypothetical protein ACVCNH_18070 [Achromobacter anxifer]